MVQAVVSYLSSHRLYVLACAGMSDIALDARLALGENLRLPPMGFYDRAGAGYVVSVLQRDFETVTNYGWDVLSQVATIVARMLLDEATSSLDAINEVAVQQAIAELVRGKTVVAVAHRLNSIREVDNIVVIDGGRVVTLEDYEWLMAHLEPEASFDPAKDMRVMGAIAELLEGVRLDCDWRVFANLQKALALALLGRANLHPDALERTVVAIIEAMLDEVFGKCDDVAIASI